MITNHSMYAVTTDWSVCVSTSRQRIIQFVGQHYVDCVVQKIKDLPQNVYETFIDFLTNSVEIVFYTIMLVRNRRLSL